MKSMSGETFAVALLDRVRGTILHPQWLSLRYHEKSRVALGGIRDAMVIDLGSGNADIAGRLGAGCRVIRVDYPGTSIRYRGKPDVFADARNMPVADESVDAVLLLEVLEHIPDDRAALLEVQRIVKSGGVFAISVPFVYPEHDSPYDFRRYTTHGVNRMMEQAGFEIVAERRHGNSMVVAFQLLNLALLEAARSTMRANRGAGWLCAALCYPVCLAINLLAVPFCYLPIATASYFGCFVLARKRQ